ncbi:MAG TPA: ABC transporter permease [Stellaceae bacterium]|jgi:putative ABC transport system permease protein
MSVIALLGAVEIGLIFGLASLGVWITFRVLDFPDLTVDGSFATGGAVAATLIAGGLDPFAATVVAVAAGVLAGIVTAWMNTRFGILHLLAGILTMIALYSVNLRIMGRPNVPLLGDSTVFTPLDNIGLPTVWLEPAALAVLTVIVTAALDRYLLSETGLALRAAGANPRMARANGIRTERCIIIGVALGNALVALAGALFAQSQQSADVSMGIGTIVVGLASVIIGETLVPGPLRRSIVAATAACVAGSVVYRLVVNFALNLDFIGLRASDLNLVTAVLVLAALGLPTYRRRRAARAAAAAAAAAAAPRAAT